MRSPADASSERFLDGGPNRLTDSELYLFGLGQDGAVVHKIEKQDPERTV